MMCYTTVCCITKSEDKVKVTGGLKVMKMANVCNQKTNGEL